MKYTATLLLIAASIALASGQFECPARDGQFMDENQCDKYYICVDGEAEELLCEDGLVFDPFKRTDYKCDLPSLVDCSGREALQRPQPIGDCPRRYGMFEHPDSSVCNMMLSCIDGEQSYFTCPGDLVFDADSGDCTWPENANREGCRPQVQIVLEDGFQCPKEELYNDDGSVMAHPSYPHLDCQKFYTCVDGTVPRLQSCAEDQTFNPVSRICEYYEDVEICGREYIEKNIIQGRSFSDE